MYVLRRTATQEKQYAIIAHTRPYTQDREASPRNKAKKEAYISSRYSVIILCVASLSICLPTAP